MDFSIFKSPIQNISFCVKIWKIQLRKIQTPYDKQIQYQLTRLKKKYFCSSQVLNIFPIRQFIELVLKHTKICKYSKNRNGLRGKKRKNNS